MRINLKALNEFRKNLEERTIPKKKIIYTPEIFIMYLWKIYKEVRNSKNAGKIPISSLEEKFYNKFRLGNDEFRKLMRICGYIYPENLSFYQISEIVAKKFNKKPFYIENIPYFFISMEKPFRNPYKRQKEDKQGKLTSYIGGGEGR